VLTDLQIARMRVQQTAALPDAGVLLRVTRSTDAFGGQSESWHEEATLACRVSVPSGKEGDLAGKITEQRAAVLTFSQGSDVQPGDRLRVGGHVYELLALLEDGSWSTALRALATEVGG